MWKRDYPDFKVSWPVEDICNLCYTFAHCHKFFADHTTRRSGHGNDNDEQDEADNDVGDNNSPDVVEEIARLMEGINLNKSDCASDKVAEQREQMMLEAADHIKMARAQRKLYHDKVEKEKMSVDKTHLQRTYTFVVDYGQNMELPLFNEQQAGAMYYLSPMTVNNLCVVNHAHVYPDGKVCKQMH